MTIKSALSTSAFSRRGFLGVAAAAASVPLLAACGGGSASQGAGGTIKFWDMPWGPPAYSDLAKKLTESYVPTGSLGKASYQTIQWNNFYQTFSSAIASKTGPALSTGGGFQAFQFAEQGQIAYADNVISKLKQNGQYNDFLPGTIESQNTDKGYVAVPWSQGPRVVWYRKSLLDRAGVAVPTDWKSWLEAGKALKGIGVSAFGIGAGAGNVFGNQNLLSMMINNGGGLFNEDGRPDVVTDRNIEAMEFVREMVSLGLIDPGAVSYTLDNLSSQWKDKKIGMGWYAPGLPESTGDTSGDLQVASPLAGPHGDKGTVNYIGSIMMYKNTPSQEGSEAFLLWYLGQLKEFWKQDVVGLLPVQQSIVDLPEFQKNKQNVQIIKEWQSVGKPFGTKSPRLFGSLAAVDGGQALSQFAQTMLGARADAKTALTDLQKGIESVTK
ncbi:ABC transporter substrate-binding protein [Arthrobacter sp. B2a2-09]|uniref:ABC transporter substrate-binding protein n=1 Tax=Arthrobacter sp. B2a2-09 TaxID=2952822 RepID=UPI0022CD5E1C|nr:extracellular solute-binding protein [Arthrobacter sp. B2a2-09]MCZ9881647.1 extracellular solute-binding protein [Arthrobacter sp. B2a2-09]